MTKNFNQSPLPFMGQKRQFLKEFKTALKSFPHHAVYVDLFGGSGLLSRTIKDVYPKATVIYNDYDNYSQRIENIANTNSVLSDLRAILNEYPKEKKIVGKHLSKVLSRIEIEEKKGYVDYVTLSSSVQFSMNYSTSFEELSAQALYNNVIRREYNATGYLEGLTIVHEHYKDLFLKYKDKENVVFAIDPPYLSTETTHYKNYWKLSQYLDVLELLTDTNYFYFTSDKSTLVELFEWIACKTGYNPFIYANKVVVNRNPTSNSSYTDIMFFRSIG